MAMQGTSSGTFTIGATSVEVAKNHTGILKRTQLIITNTSAAAIATIVKGDVAAVANAGVVLQPNGVYVESTDGGYTCWQGAVQVVGSAAGSVAVVESWDVTERG
jgi:hypothetical protein